MAINFLNTVAVDENVLFVDTVNARVGIGTDSPQSTLDVRSDASDSVPKIIVGNSTTTYNQTNSGSIVFTEGGTFEHMEITYNGASNKLLFNSPIDSATGLLTINRTGNVGIGTTGPSNTLHVFKNATIGPITSPTVANAGLRIQDNGASLYVDGNSLATDSAGYLTTINNNHFDIGTNSTSRIHITGAGNVGIETTSPSEKLDVNGNVKIKDALLSNQENTDIDTGAEVVAQVAHATYTAAFFDFVVKKGTNVRSGTVYACHNGDTTPLVEFTETSTNDLGDTSDVTLSVDISGTNMRLLATVTSDDWSVKSLIRAI